MIPTRIVNSLVELAAPEITKFAMYNRLYVLPPEEAVPAWYIRHNWHDGDNWEAPDTAVHAYAIDLLAFRDDSNKPDGWRGGEMQHASLIGQSRQNGSQEWVFRCMKGWLTSNEQLRYTLDNWGTGLAGIAHARLEETPIGFRFFLDMGSPTPLIIAGKDRAEASSKLAQECGRRQTLIVSVTQ